MKYKLIAGTLVLCLSLLCLYTVSQQTVSREISDLIKVLNEPETDRLILSASDAQSKRKSRAIIRLLQLGKGDIALPHLSASLDPAARSYFIRDASRYGLSASAIIAFLQNQKNVSVKIALILALGECEKNQVSLQQRNQVVPYLLDLYTRHPDAGIHSAIDWLLRDHHRGAAERSLRWNQAAVLNGIDSMLSRKAPVSRNWYVNGKGHTLSIIRGPVTFVMGSPGNEPGRDKSPIEAEHLQEVPRSFAIATKEITVKQFHDFLDANPSIKRNAEMAGPRSPMRSGELLRSKHLTDDCPQISITWFEAAQYCNWLSQQEGIPEEEWCYPSSMEQIKEGLMLSGDYLNRTGYRLPTEAEFEYACRAGSRTSRFFGNSEELLREYAWYTGSSFNEKPWPVGQLKPNDFGLFDVYGNVWEWGQDLVKYYISNKKDTVFRDIADSVSIVSKDYKRPRKGGSFSYGADFQRSAYRNSGYIPDERRDNVGFRVARTIREK